MTRKTILNDAHRALGARMVDFGGWDMPLHYGSQVDEHHLVRGDAGMFDVSHMTVVDLRGARVREFLRSLVANSVDKLQKPGKALYTCMLDSRGGVVDDLIIYLMPHEGGAEWFRAVVNALPTRPVRTGRGLWDVGPQLRSHLVTRAGASGLRAATRP